MVGLAKAKVVDVFSNNDKKKEEERLLALFNQNHKDDLEERMFFLDEERTVDGQTMKLTKIIAKIGPTTFVVINGPASNPKEEGGMVWVYDVDGVITVRDGGKSEYRDLSNNEPRYIFKLRQKSVSIDREKMMLQSICKK